MGRIFDAVQQFLTAENLRYDKAAEATALRFGFRTEQHSWMCVAEVREEQEFLLFVSVLPEPVAEPRRAAVAELLTRINAGTAIGNFEMEWEAGVVRFRTAVDLEGTEAGAPLMRQLLRANLSSVAKFIGAVEQVARGAATPVEAMLTVAP